MNMIWLFGLPSPGTGFLRVFQSSHLQQARISAAIASKSALLDKIASSPFTLFFFMLISLNGNCGKAIGEYMSYSKGRILEGWVSLLVKLHLDLLAL